jgi:N-acetylmuramoyl-L-alanine amidase
VTFLPLRRGIAAVMGAFMLAATPGAATAAPVAGIAPVTGVASTAASKPAATKTVYLANGKAVQAMTSTAAQAATLGSATAAAVATMSGAMVPASAAITSAMAVEAAWLHRSGWPLYALANRYSAGAPLDEQANCIAIAVYHEARGETLEGQLAVAKVIMNRAASGKYPSTWCQVVKQPWQFSFVNPRTGHIPYVDRDSQAWRNALGITRLAISGAVPVLSNDVLWYHADYVAPSWGRRLERARKIGAHIFYRA